MSQIPPEWQRFVTLRDDLLAAIRAHLQRDGHCKPYEGAFTLELPNVFNSECVIKLSCYVIGPHRHYTWTGPTFAAALDQCERDVRMWIYADVDDEDEEEEDTRLHSVVELYRSDPMAMADSLWRMREEVGALRTRLEQLEQRPE